MSWPPELTRWAEQVSQDAFVFRTVMRRARNCERAREAIQQALSRVPPRYDHFLQGGYGYFSAWVCRVARNYLVDWFRIANRERQLGNGEALPDRKDPDAERREQQLALLEQVIAELPSEQQQLVRSRLKGNTYQKMAEATHVNVGTVWRRLREPLQYLRLRLLEVDSDLFRELP
jgi:RNA polymerase sigma factor (sigma-70 family)